MTKYKKFRLLTIAYLIGGIAVTAIGIIRYIYGTPLSGMNWRHQPVVVDGSMIILLGAILLLMAGYKIVFRIKSFEEEKKNQMQEYIDEYRKMLKEKGYGNKRIKRKVEKKTKKMEELNKNRLYFSSI